MLHRTTALVLALSAVALPGRALRLAPPFDEAWLAPSGQAFLDPVPKGALGDDEWDWSIAAGQALASSLLGTAGAVFFTIKDDRSHVVPIDTVRHELLVNSVVELAAMPLLTGIGAWSIGSLSDMYQYGFLVPVAAGYVLEAVVLALRMAVTFGVVDLKHGDQVRQSVDVLSAWLYADWILHAIAIPLASTFFMQRSRDPRADLMAARPKRPAALAVAPGPTYRSVSDERELEARPTRPDAGARLVLALAAF